MSPIALILTEVTKRYGERSVLKRLSYRFEEGCITYVVGASGCGKTTLLRLLLGLETPDSGTITGRPDSLAAVFQTDRLLEHLSARRNLRSVLTRRVSQAEIDAMLSSLELDPNDSKPVAAFSGGMRRRVALARALLAGAELTVLDEPMTGLDRDTRLLCTRVAVEALRGRTAVWVTHATELIPEDRHILRL